MRKYWIQYRLTSLTQSSKSTKPDQLTQIHQIKSTKPNSVNKIYLIKPTEPNLLNQIYQNESSNCWG